MGDLDNFDYNDVIDQINDQNPQVQEMASVSNDSNLPSSISGFGIDENNPEENEHYIQENQNLQAAGFQNRQSQYDSGLTRSISRTRSSESIPESYESPINQVDPENQIAHLSFANVDDDVIDGAKQIENEDHAIVDVFTMSSYDLALKKGYVKQAELFDDFQIAPGVFIQSKYRKKIWEIIHTAEELEAHIHRYEFEEFDEEYWSQVYALEIFRMKIAALKQNLLDLENNNFDKVLKRMDEQMIEYEKDYHIKNMIISNKNQSSFKPKVINLVKEEIKRDEKLVSRFLKGFAKMERKKGELLKLGQRIKICRDILKRKDLTSEKRENVQQRLDMSLKKSEALSILRLAADGATQKYPETSSDYMYSSDSNADRLHQPGPSNNSIYAKDPKAAQSYTLARRIQRQNSSDSDVEDTNGDNRC